MGNTFQSMQSSCGLTDQISLLCRQVTPIPHCTVRETTTNQTISLPGLVAEMGKPKESHVLDFRIISLQAAASLAAEAKLGQSEGRAGCFQSPELWSRYLLSVKSYIPGLDLCFAPCPRLQQGGCRHYRGMPQGEPQFQLATKGPEEAQSYLGGRGAGREGKYCP